MKINLDKKLNTLTGEPLKINGEDLTLGKVLAEVATHDQMGGKHKMYSLALKFSAGGEVEIDSADLLMMKKAIDATKVGWNNVVLGQTLEVLESIK